jgi:hypothetical protein
MGRFITTADIAQLEGIEQRTIQKRIKRLGIVPEKAGSVFLLTNSQAERVRRDKRKPGPPKKNGNGHK